LQLGIVIKRVIDLGEPAASRRAGTARIRIANDYKAIPAYRAEATYGKNGQGSIQECLASVQYAIIILAGGTGDPELQSSISTLRIIVTDHDSQWIQGRRAQDSSVQENVSFAQGHGCIIQGGSF
jgi:hypothetical protein